MTRGSGHAERMARRNYVEGEWFLIPVPETYLADAPEHRFGAGLVARGTRGRVVFAYVFGPWESEPPAEQLATLEAGGELLVLLMPDDGLRSGSFPLLGLAPGFSRERWPMPEFSMYMGGDEPATAVRTSDDQPFEPVDRRPISPDEARALPQWAISGYAKIFRKLADPGARVQRLADLYERQEARSHGVRRLEVHFVVPRSAERLVGDVRDALESRGWTASISPIRDGEAESIWVSGSRPFDRVAELDAVDREMNEVAAALPGVEYDGHGISL